MDTETTTYETGAGRRARRRGPLLLAAALAVLALLLGACGDDDGNTSDETTTTADEETTTTEDEEEEEEPEEFDPSEGEVEEGGAIAMNSETISDCLDEGESIDYEISVPDGSTGILTVTPDSSSDIVVETLSEIVDDGLSGEAEVLEGEGPIEETVAVYEFFGDAGCFELTLES